MQSWGGAFWGCVGFTESVKVLALGARDVGLLGLAAAIWGSRV